MNELRNHDNYTLITGGAGFIGINLADKLLSLGRNVMIYDNLSRSGVKKNLQWLKEKYGDRVVVEVSDIREKEKLQRCVNGAEQIFHFLAQVAVTSSLTDPANDFEVNVAGTFHLLEAIRRSPTRPPLIFTSTNKVYGDLSHYQFDANAQRYYPVDDHINRNGIDESSPLEFHSPYGCSKGAADQYVLDFSRSYGLKTAVFRMSCIYGPHQFGNEDQGWIAHFAIRALEKKPIAIFGNGKQVRDILFVEDLLNAFLLAEQHINQLSGNAYNIGGGPENSVSLVEVIKLIEQRVGATIDYTFESSRMGDQLYYVSNYSKFNDATGWLPKVSVSQGMEMLISWLCETRGTSFKNNYTRILAE